MKTRLLLGCALLAVVLLVGCSGRGGDDGVGAGGFDRFSPAGLSDAQKQGFVLRQTTTTAEMAQEGAFGVMDSAFGGLETLFPVIMEALVESFGPLEAIIGGAIGEEQAPSVSDLVGALAAVSTTSAGLSQLEEGGLFGDGWDDPVYEITWKGEMQGTGPNTTAVIRGTGPDADVLLQFAITMTYGYGAKLTGSVSGQMPAAIQTFNFDTQDYGFHLGTASGTGDLKIEVLAQTLDRGTATMVVNSDIAYSSEAGQQLARQKGSQAMAADWVLKKYAEAAQLEDGDWYLEALNGTGNGELYQGYIVDGGLFWGRHTWKAKLTASTQAPSGENHMRAVLNDTMSFSNGWSARLSLDSVGTMTGWIKDAEGKLLADITGTQPTDGSEGVTPHADWKVPHDPAIQELDWLWDE